MDNTTISTKDYFAILIIAGFGFVIRSYAITSEGLWLDELITVNAAGIQSNLRHVYDVLHFWDQSPPMFDVILHFYFHVVGMDDFTARLFVVLCGVAGIVAVYFCSIYVFNSKVAGLYSAIIFCLSPYHIYFSREVRAYILASIWVTLSLTFFYKILSKPSLIIRIGYVLCSGAMLLSSYMAFFVFFAQILYLIFQYVVGNSPFTKKELIADGCTFAGVGILYLPWVYPFYRVMQMWNGYDNTPDFDFIIHLVSAFSSTPYTVGIMLTCCLVICSLYYLILSNKEPLQYFLFMFLVILVGMYAKSLLGRNVLKLFTFSYQIVLFNLWVWIIVYCIIQQKNTIRLAFLGLIVAYFGIQIMCYGAGLSKKAPQNYRELTCFIKENFSEKVPVFCSRAWDHTYYWYIFQVKNVRYGNLDCVENPEYYKIFEQLPSDTLLIFSEFQLNLLDSCKKNIQNFGYKFHGNVGPPSPNLRLELWCREQH